jgi:hypothetical protein
MNNIIKIIRITSFVFLFSLNTIAQIAINSDGSSPDASAMLDITSSDKGILIPRMTTAERTAIASPATGLLVYDTDENSFWYYANSTWNNLSNTILADADSDTKIQVEESSDEDIIRFDLGGTEFMRLDNGRIETPNTGRSVFLGEGAGASDDLTTNFNNFLGYHAGYVNTSGAFNNFIGDYSGYDNTTGLYNTFLGSKSGYSNITGDKNTFIGRKAGNSNTTGSNNIFIGYEAGFSETNSNRLYIESSNVTSPLIYGEFDNDFLQINGNLAVTDGFTDADNDTKIQVEESSDEDMIRFDLGGTEYFRLDKGRLEFINTGNSIFIGKDAGDNDDYIDNHNIFIGYQAGIDNTSGVRNNFLGYQAGYNNITSSRNTFLGYKAGFTTDSGSGRNVYLGYEAGYSNQTGDYNVFIGNSAGYNETGSNKLYIDNSNSSSPLIYGEFDNNFLKVNGKLSATGGFTDTDLDTKIHVEESSDEDIIRFDLGGTEYFTMNNGRLSVVNTGNSVFIGEFAGENDDLSNNNNVALGRGALRINISGEANMAIGTSSLENCTGDFNTAIGFNSGLATTTGEENVFLGFSAGVNVVGGSKNVMIGNYAGGSSDVSRKLFIDNSSTDSPLIWGDFSGNRVVINGNDTDNANNRTLFVNGAAGGTTSWQNDSDRRLKTNIQTIPNALNKVLEMRGVTYQWKDGRETGDRMGFIAQEVEPILPEVVDNKNDHYTMQYAPITAVLVEAMKEQQTEIDGLKKQIDDLKTQVQKIDQLEAQLEALLSGE